VINVELVNIWYEDELLLTVRQFDANSVEVELPHEICKLKLEKALKQLVYGIEGYVEERKLYITRLEESGLTPKGKQIMLSLGFKEDELEHNYILLLPLAVLLALVVLCSIPVVGEWLPFCAELAEIWEKIKPYIIYGSIAAITVSVAALAYRAIAGGSK